MHLVPFHRALACSWVLGPLLVVAGSAATASAAMAPELQDAAEPLRSDNGVAFLEWESEAELFQVELSSEDEPADIAHEGRLKSAHLSGLENGTYVARVRAQVDGEWTDWSQPRSIIVEHIAMSVVTVLLSLGAITFGATATVVLTQAKRDAQ